MKFPRSRGLSKAISTAKVVPEGSDAHAHADADADAHAAHAAHAHAAAAAAAAVVDDDDAHVAWAEAQKLRASSVLRSAVVVQPGLRSSDVYVLASQAASFSACLLPTGLGVHIEVSEGGGTRELDVPMQLPPTSGLPVDVAFFSRAGVWKFRWLLPPRPRRARKVACSSPRRDLAKRRA